MNAQTERRLALLKLNLLKSRGWRYLRYMHLLSFVKESANEINSVGVAGVGLGFAELAIALEHPEIEFFLTDAVMSGRPNYFRVMELVMRWDIPNVKFGIWDLMTPAPRKFDAVTSTEVLEHLAEPRIALDNQAEAARKFVYALAPYATARDNANAEKRLATYIKNEHLVCGYDERLFADVAKSRQSLTGVYWVDAGLKFRSKLQQLNDSEIEETAEILMSEALADVRSSPPAQSACLGVRAIIAT